MHNEMISVCLCLKYILVLKGETQRPLDQLNRE